jgi:hypothetical protein
MKDPLDPGTIEFPPAFFDQQLVNAVANLESIFTVDGTQATPEINKLVSENVRFSNIELLERKINELEGRISYLEANSTLLLDKLVYILGKDAAPS